jgi:hypothetical protein
LPLFAGWAIGCWIYVLEDRKAFRAFPNTWLDCVVVLEVKKFAAGLLEWNDRIGIADLNMGFETTPSVLVSRNGWRIVNAILSCITDEKQR